MSTTLDQATLLPYEWPGSYFIGDEEKANVMRVLEARSPFRFYGHDLQGYAETLEAAYRQRLGRNHALAVSSGTVALAAAMSALNLGPGDEVLIPGYFWVSCVAAVVRAGAIPRLVEVDASFVMDPDDLERKIGPHSKAVLIVHMSGATGALDRLIEMARKHDLKVIEDVAQANGGSYCGKPLGSFGDVAIFSFQLNKNITGGEGGLLACDDDALYRRALAVHDLGYPRNAQGRLVMDDPEAQFWGLGGRMGELPAAMLVAQEKKLDSIVAAMHRAGGQLYAGLEGIAGARARWRPDPAGDSSPFVLLIWPDEQTCRTMTAATRERGVKPGPKGIGNIPLAEFGLHLYYNNPSLVQRRGFGTSGFPWSAPENAFARDYSYREGLLPATDDLFRRSSLLTAPPTLTEEACNRIVGLFSESAAVLGLNR